MLTISTMQAVRPSQVPEYLRASEFYLGLNVADDDEFFIPSNHMKLDTNIDKLADMTELLNTVRYWGCGIFPQAMLDFVARQPHDEVKAILEPYQADLQFIFTLCAIVLENSDCSARLEIAMDTGNLDAVHYFHNKAVPFTTRAVALAAGKGALDCLEYALSPENAGFYSQRSCNNVFCEAVCNGRMDSIIFLQQSEFPLVDPNSHSFFYSHFCEKEYVDLVEIAAFCGRLDVLKYLHKQGCSIRLAALAADDAGQRDCYEYALRNGAQLFCHHYSRSYKEMFVQRLASANQPKLLALALSHGSQIDVHTPLDFRRCDWECLALFVKHIARPSIQLICAAARNGFLSSLHDLYALCVTEVNNSGNGLNWLAYAATVSSSRVGCLYPTGVAQVTAEAQQWECLRFLITHGCPMNKQLTTTLVHADQLELYHLAAAHGCIVSVPAASQFASIGNFTFLQHALEHGCERSEEILRAAARHGQLQCLKYAHAQGCPCSAQVSLAAARGGHLECLQYLHEHGCPLHAHARSVRRKLAT